VETLPYRDVTELHAGAEYTLPGRTPIAIRAGWWRDPAHSGAFAERPLSTIAGETDEDHLTIGAGLLLGPARLDVSVDHADDSGNRRAAIALTHSF
jgi:hypothetical protein